MPRFALLLISLLLAAPAVAQERPRDGAPQPDTVTLGVLPDSVAERAVEAFNDTLRVHFRAPTTIPAGGSIGGDVAVLGGPVTVGGEIDGHLLVVNGDVTFRPGARVSRGVLVVGGDVRGDDGASIGGELEVHPEPLRYREEGGRLVRAEEPLVWWDSRGVRARAPWGGSDFLVTVGKSYNRVEGLPVVFGPRVETAGSNPLRVQALGVYRTEAGLTIDPGEMGYIVRAEQFLGGHREYRVGLTVHSQVDPIEERNLTDLENSLATFLFHRDQRDHMEREGYGAFVMAEPEGAPYALQAAVLRETHRSLAARSPWSLLDNGDPWRPQPLLAEGELTTLRLDATYDTRSQSFDPATGWFLRAGLERSLEVDLTRPAALLVPEDDPASLTPVPAARQGLFTVGTLDVRRYNRVDPTSRLNFRLLVSGSLNGEPLPAQRQHTLGGVGTLPGFDLFDLDCGARSERLVLSADAVTRTFADEPGPFFFPAYGCDAVALLQAEYRGKLAFRFGWGDDEIEEEDLGGLGWDFSPEWSFFVDAGRGWSLGDRLDEDVEVDVGLGLLFDPVGVYLAAPVTGGGGVNLFVRLGPRL